MSSNLLGIAPPHGQPMLHKGRYVGNNSVKHVERATEKSEDQICCK